jgi:hypothetical protein
MFICSKCDKKYTNFKKTCECGSTNLTYQKDVVEGVDGSLSSSASRGTYADRGIAAFIKKYSTFYQKTHGQSEPVLSPTWLEKLQEYLAANREPNQCDGCLAETSKKRVHAHNILSAVILNYFPPQVVVSFARLFYNQPFVLHSSLKIRFEPTGPMAKVAAAWGDWLPNLHQTRQTLEKLCVALMGVTGETQLRMLAKMRLMVWLNMDKAPKELVDSLPALWDRNLPRISVKPPAASQMNKPLLGSSNAFLDSVFKINGDNAKRFGFALQCTDCENDQGSMALPWRYFAGEPGARLRAFIDAECHENPFLLAMDLSSMALSDMWRAFVNGDRTEYGYVYGHALATEKNWHLFMIYFTVCMFEGALGSSPFRAEENLVFSDSSTYC